VVMLSKRTDIPRIVILLIAAGLLQHTGSNLAEDRDFGHFVKEIESRFHVKRTHVPLLGVVKPSTKFMHTGAKSLEVAIFEDQDFSEVDSKDFVEAASKALGPEWHALIQVVSRRDGEQTYIYVRDDSNSCRLIIATLEPREAVVTEVKISGKDLFRLIDHPDEMDQAGKRILEEDEDE